jgi:hypothetical protein
MKKEPVEMVKTTLRMPRTTWLKARTRALEEGMDFQDLVVSAIELWLKAPKRKEGER